MTSIEETVQCEGMDLDGAGCNEAGVNSESGIELVVRADKMVELNAKLIYMCSVALCQLEICIMVIGYAFYHILLRL